MTDTTDQQAVTVAQEGRHAAGLCDPANRVDYKEGKRGGSTLVQTLARHRLASVSSASAEGFVLVPRDDDTRDLSDSILPAAMIGAGIEVLDKVQIDSLDYQAGTTTDWDDGMVAVAVYRAMLAASPEPVPATNQAGEVDAAIRIAVWDACRDRGLSQDSATMLVRKVMAEPVLLAALDTQPATSQEIHNDIHFKSVASDIRHQSTVSIVRSDTQSVQMRDDVRLLKEAFRKAAQGHGRAGTADWPGGPYMAMDDAADVYASLVAADDLRVSLQEAHDTLHECTAVLTANDCSKVAAVMARIRAALDTQPATSQEGEEQRNLEAQRQAIEASARIADVHAEPTDTPDDFTRGYEIAASKIARSIRKLAPNASLAATPTPLTLSEDLREADQDDAGLCEILSGFALRAVQAWKRNSGPEMDEAIDEAVQKIRGVR